MENYIATAGKLVLLTTFAVSSIVMAGKPSGSAELQPYLEGPILNPNAEATSSTQDTALGGEMIYYGDNAGFIQHEVLLSNNQRSYVTVVCVQGDNVVYQASQWGADLLVFTMEDLAGQGLEWYQGSGPASCTATLVVNEKRGKKVTITQVDQVAFDVM